jgi:hypothetical protein
LFGQQTSVVKRLTDIIGKLYSGLQHPVFTFSLETLVEPQTPNGWKVGDKQMEKMWQNAVVVLYEMLSGICFAD